MEQITRIGLDTSKRFFQLHGVDANEKPVLRRQLPRGQVMGFFKDLPPDAHRDGGVRRISSLGP